MGRWLAYFGLIISTIMLVELEQCAFFVYYQNGLPYMGRVESTIASVWLWLPFDVAGKSFDLIFLNFLCRA